MILLVINKDRVNDDKDDENIWFGCMSDLWKTSFIKVN